MPLPALSRATSKKIKVHSEYSAKKTKNPYSLREVLVGPLDLGECLTRKKATFVGCILSAEPTSSM